MPINKDKDYRSRKLYPPTGAKGRTEVPRAMEPQYGVQRKGRPRQRVENMVWYRRMIRTEDGHWIYPKEFMNRNKTAFATTPKLTIWGRTRSLRMFVWKDMMGWPVPHKWQLPWPKCGEPYCHEPDHLELRDKANIGRDIARRAWRDAEGRSDEGEADYSEEELEAVDIAVAAAEFLSERDPANLPEPLPEKLHARFRLILARRGNL